MCQERIANCKFCDKQFKSFGKIYCSRDCYDLCRESKWRKKGFNCKSCNKRVESPSSQRKTQFCSMSCRSNFYRTDRHIKCSWCKVEFSPIKWRKSTKSNTYSIDISKSCCSRECRISVYTSCEERKRKIGLAETGSKHHNWSGGGKRRGYRGKNWLKIAEDCRERAGRVCEHCGKTERDNGRKLDVNHIIPFFQWNNKEKANHKSNLEALCKSCHRKSDAKWKRENPVQLGLNAMFETTP